jgi:hypothetical protein
VGFEMKTKQYISVTDAVRVLQYCEVDKGIKLFIVEQDRAD